VVCAGDFLVDPPLSVECLNLMVKQRVTPALGRRRTARDHHDGLFSAYAPAMLLSMLSPPTQ